MTKIRVLVVDDSSFLRRTLPRLLETDPFIQVVGTAENGAEAVEKIKTLHPDVVTMDVVMPVMDGLTALKRIMRDCPLPVIMLSSMTDDGTRETLDALSAGAVDFMVKPSGPISLDIEAIRTEIIGKVRTASVAKPRITPPPEPEKSKFRSLIESLQQEAGSKTPSAGMPQLPVRGEADMQKSKRLVALASSTGGPAALQVLLPGLPADLKAGVVIVQHIAAGFTQLLAERLDELSKIKVKEAVDSQIILPGTAHLCPAGVHMTIVKSGPDFFIRLKPEPSNALYRPSADILFNSIAESCASDVCAVIMTGMGDDGAAGMKAIRRKGGHTIAQDEATSLIYGMSRRAVEIGGAVKVLPLQRIAAEITRVVNPAG